MRLVHPLDIPEILDRVGCYVKIWHSIGPDRYEFRPQDMLALLRVSRSFQYTLLPILWYALDERAMREVPIDIIQKHMPYVRIYYNYRNRYAIHDRPPCTRLIQLTINNIWGTLQCNDMEFIKSNTGLKRLEIGYKSCLCTPWTDMLHNLGQLEHLRIRLSGNIEIQALLQPVSETLKVLHLYFMYSRSNFDGLHLPNLRELLVALSKPRDIVILLSACPNLESLGTIYWPQGPSNLAPGHSEALIPALMSGACPALKRLAIHVHAGHEGNMAEALECRTGLQRLAIDVAQVTEGLAMAINHHASSLTHLTLQVTTLQLDTIFQILSSCGQLKDVTFHNVGDNMLQLISAASWMNPDTLEAISLTANKHVPGKEEKEWLKEWKVRWSGRPQTGDVARVPVPVGQLNGWRIVPGAVDNFHEQEFLKTLFDAAAGFRRLGTLTVDCVVFAKNEQGHVSVHK
ncbi:hypothetical protein B0O80DRAFT_499762 [Mortierella sp. GBAus27b]|nr:hypothetical protein B0O80DRAFT_499762 [Mortierella sp. GBAus27b]